MRVLSFFLCVQMVAGCAPVRFSQGGNLTPSGPGVDTIRKRAVSARLKATSERGHLAVKAVGSLECAKITNTPMTKTVIEGTHHTASTWAGNLFWGAVGIGGLGYGFLQAIGDRGDDETEADLQLRRTWGTAAAVAGTAITMWAIHKLLDVERLEKKSPKECCPKECCPKECRTLLNWDKHNPLERNERPTWPIG